MKNKLLILPQVVMYKSALLLLILLFSTQSYADDCGHISGFAFSNGSSSVTISNNESYYINDLPSNFYVDVLVDGDSESASIKVKNLDTGQSVTVGENYLPYTNPAGNGAWSYGTGNFEIVAKIFEDNYCYGDRCDKEKIRFTITNTPSCGQIDGLEFSNGTNAVTLVNGGSYDIANLPYNFYVDVKVSGMTESAFNKVTNLDTGEVYTNGENYLPYTYPSGNQAWTLGTGTFQFYSEIFKYDNCQGVKCDHVCITFTIFEDNCGEITSFEFSNSTDVLAIVDGGTYDINSLPVNPYMDAIVSGGSESLRFEVENLDTGDTYAIIENYLPYTFPAGGGAWFLGTGNFMVKASLFSGNYCNSTLCDEKTFTVTITEGTPITCEDTFAGTGTIANTNSTVIIGQSGVETLTIIPNDDAVLPEGVTLGLMVTQGSSLIIRALSSTTNVEISFFGSFKVHLFAYDPTTLDLSTVVFGQTKATDILNTIDANGLCASIAPGIPFVAIPEGIAKNQVVDTKDTKDNEISATIKIEDVIEDISVDIKLYPNPVVDNLNVELLLLDAEVMNYTMLDLNGKQVLSGSFDNSTLGKTQVDTSKLSNGLYIVTFESNFRRFSKKVQVSH